MSLFAALLSKKRGIFDAEGREAHAAGGGEAVQGRRLDLDELQDHVAVALAGPRIAFRRWTMPVSSQIHLSPAGLSSRSNPTFPGERAGERLERGLADGDADHPADLGAGRRECESARSETVQDHPDKRTFDPDGREAHSAG